MTQKQILSTLRRIEAMLWVENPDERIRKLEQRLGIAEGNADLLDVKIKELERYFGVTFVKDQKYEKRKAQKTK